MVVEYTRNCELDTSTTGKGNFVQIATGEIPRLCWDGTLIPRLFSTIFVGVRIECELATRATVVLPCERRGHRARRKIRKEPSRKETRPG